MVTFSEEKEIDYYFKNERRLIEWRQMRYAIVLDNIYRATHEEIQQYLKDNSSSSIATYISKLYTVLKNAQRSKKIDFIKWHRRFLSYLRKAYSAKNREVDAIIVEKIAYARFVKVECYSFATRLIDLVILHSLKKKYPHLVNGALLSKRRSLSIEEEFALIDAAQWDVFKPSFIYLTFRKIWGRFNTNFDPHKYNHPYVLYTLNIQLLDQQQKNIKVLRMGTPTRELCIGMEAKVIPEFKAFLAYNERNALTHLYINKQQMCGLEAARSKSLLELPRFFPHFVIVSLPSDGTFYHATAFSTGSVSFSTFKEHVLETIVESPRLGHFFFPEKWLKDNLFIGAIDQILENIYEDFFSRRKELNYFDIFNFIDHFYTQLELFIMQYVKPDTVNITCKDGIDRAAKEQTKLLYYLQVLSASEDTLPSIEERLFVMHAPAFFVKKRAIVASRRGRLTAALNSYTPDVKERLRKRHAMRPIVLTAPKFYRNEDVKIFFN